MERAQEQSRAMAPGRKREKDGEGGVSVQEKPKARPKLERPRMHRVILHNDDYTPRDFVVGILQYVFNKGESDAETIMLHAHNNGFAVVGLYTREIAETKVEEVLRLANEANFPLLCTHEPDEAPGEEE
jgi:ATP-dependent Clp protease adaptor protein ClpS